LVEFCQDLWNQNYCAVCSAIMVEHWLVTYAQADTTQAHNIIQLLQHVLY